MNFANTVEPFAAMRRPVQDRLSTQTPSLERRHRGRRFQDSLPAGSPTVERRRNGRRLQDRFSARGPIAERRRGSRRLQDLLTARSPIILKANPTPREDASSFTPLVVVISSFVLLLGVAVFATHPNPGQQSKPQVAAAAPRFAFEQYNLGTAYSSGHGVPQSYAEAAKWYRAAAEQGFAGAQYNLGAAYTIGRGVSQDYAEAAKWYRKAAEQGHAEAQYNLGVLYRDGQGVPQDYVAAYTWLTLAMATTWEPRWIKTRDALQHRMTPLQIAEGMQRTAEFVAKKTPATSQ